MPSTLILRAAGTNCESELARAFTLAGASVSLVHLDRVIARPAIISQHDIIAFPGGFSFGDDVASGRIFAMRVRRALYPALRESVLRGCPIIGVCNGFQILVQVGLLPGPAAGDWPADDPPPQSTSLTFNQHARFIDRWLPLSADPTSPCIWTRGLAHEFADAQEDVIRLPIAHGEGRFVAADDLTLNRIESKNCVSLRYLDNVNGSTNAIAGICDPSGRIFGLMPHPERYLMWEHHPYWTRLPSSVRQGTTPGLRIFQNAVDTAAQSGVLRVRPSPVAAVS